MASGDGVAAQPQPQRRPHGPRLYHKKSRTGCYRCKGRRVKCDEKRPVCSGCSRHMVECVYPTVTSPAEDGGTGSGGGGDNSGSISHSPHHHHPYNHHTSRRHAARRSEDTTTTDAANAAASSSSRRPSTVRFQDQERTDDGTRQAGQGREDAVDDDDDDLVDPPESRARRLTEMQLLTHYVFSQAATFRRPFPDLDSRTDPSGGDGNGGNSSQPQDTFLWSVETVEMAFENDGILYGLLAHSALCKWTKAVAALRSAPSSSSNHPATSPPPANPVETAEHHRHQQQQQAGWEGPEGASSSDPECARWRDLQRQYLSMALREQRRAVASLSPVTADHVCMSSLTILSHSFALVQTVPTRPAWTPPLEWLKMGHGAGKVFLVAKGHLGLGPGAAARDGAGGQAADPAAGAEARAGEGQRIRNFLNTAPRFEPEDIFAESCGAPLAWLLENPSVASTQQRQPAAGASAGGGGWRHAPGPPRPASASTAAGPASAFSPLSFTLSPAGSAGSPSPAAGLLPSPSPSSAAAATAAFASPPTRPTTGGSAAADDDDDAELHDEATRAVYERALRYVGWVERAVGQHGLGREPTFAVCRRFAAFAVWVPEGFHDFLGQRRPRALVLLAYFFSLWIPFEHVWMIGRTGRNQLRAIYEALPSPWRGKLEGLVVRHGLL